MPLRILSRLAAIAREMRPILALAWRMDARLTALYYLTAFISATVPLAAGATLALVIDRVVVTAQSRVATSFVLVVVVAMHFAVVAINAAVVPGEGGANTAIASGTQNTAPASGILMRLRQCMSTRIAGSKIHFMSPP